MGQTAREALHFYGKRYDPTALVLLRELLRAQRSDDCVARRI